MHPWSKFVDYYLIRKGNVVPQPGFANVHLLHSISIFCDAHFQNGLAPASIHVGADQITGVPVDVGSSVANLGMNSAGFEMSNGALAATGFDVAGGVPAEEATYGQPQSGSNNKPPASLKASLKAPWTEEEDR
jgi:hypothetical protein